MPVFCRAPCLAGASSPSVTNTETLEPRAAGGNDGTDGEVDGGGTQMAASDAGGNLREREMR